MHLRIATRTSNLAIRQSQLVLDVLVVHGHTGDLLPITTRGDQILDRPLSEFGGKGLFTTALDQAVIDGQADLAVHSLKDVPTRQDFLNGPLALAAIPVRAAVEDVLVARGPFALDTLPAGSRVGTSALRRTAQLLAARPDLLPLPIRGNVDTRLAKLRAGEFHALILAAAGLARLAPDLAGLTLTPLPPETFVPAASQGALAVVCRADDHPAFKSVNNQDHAPTRTTVTIERAIAADMGSTCHSAIGVWYDGTTVHAFVGGHAARGLPDIRITAPTREAALQRLHAAGADHPSRHADQ